jgi:hypothetical protein
VENTLIFEDRRKLTYLALLQALVDSSEVFPQRRVIVVLDAVVRSKED